MTELQNKVKNVNIDSKVKKVKKLIDENSTTKLHDYVVNEIEQFSKGSSEENLKNQSNLQLSPGEVTGKISKYEDVVIDLVKITSCISYWGKPEHKQILQKLVTRATDKLEIRGEKLRLAFEWYPAILQMYCAGIAAIDGQRYDSLSNIFYAKKIHSDSTYNRDFLVDSIGCAINAINDSRIFNNYEEFKAHYFAMSEHLYKSLKQTLENLVFIGDNYNIAFDEFEVLLSLVVADRKTHDGIGGYVPLGRFAPKHDRSDRSPLKRIIKEAEDGGKNWGPLKYGFFNGDYKRFIEVAENCAEMISNDSRFYL